MYTGKMLKLERIKNDISATSLSFQLDISKSYISLIESGKRKIPEELYKKWLAAIGFINLD